MGFKPKREMSIQWAGSDMPTEIIKLWSEYAMKYALNCSLTVAGNMGTFIVSDPVEVK